MIFGRTVCLGIPEHRRLGQEICPVTSLGRYGMLRQMKLMMPGNLKS